MTAVADYLEDLRPHRSTLFPVVVRLRAMALVSGPGVTEEIKYGGVLFSSRAAFCGVFAYRNHVTLEFSEGGKIADPFGVLVGKGIPEAHSIGDRARHRSQTRRCLSPGCSRRD